MENSGNIAELNAIISSSFESFLKQINESKWVGRERECVSAYTFSQLIKQCRQGSVLYNPAQIGIEYAVPQLGGKGKQQVCKDLVIWDTPLQTCWDINFKPLNYPLAIMEWKVSGFWNSRRGIHDLIVSQDIEWLKSYSVLVKNFVGYSAYISFSESHGTTGSLLVIHRGEVLN